MTPDGKQVKVINNMAAVVADGHGIGINKDNGAANLLFIQIVPNQNPNATEVEGSVVSSIRLGLDQLKQLKNDIEKNIAEYESKKAGS
jgi:hypothetical protein